MALRYEDSNAFDAANFDFTPLAAGHIVANGIAYMRVYSTQASQNCINWSCTVFEPIWDSQGHTWAWGAFPVGFPLTRTGSYMGTGNYITYEGRPNVLDGHLFYYG